MKTEERKTEERNDIWTRTECPVPVEEPCCPVTIFRLVQTEPGIREVRYDTAAHEMEIDYDPETLTDEQARAIAEDLADRVGARTAGKETPCKLRECGRRALLNTRGIEFRGDVLHVPRDSRNERRSPWVTRKIKVDRAGVTPEPSRLLAVLQRRLKALPLEPLFVLVTLIALVAGAIAERTGPAPLSWIFYGAAYLFGGYFGVQAGYASLRARKIDIDLLMVLAAIGAAAVGAPFEGALLLFLFSFSNVLQDYALDRTRSAIKALSRLRPDTAIVLNSPGDERGHEVAVADIPVGAYLQVRPGDRIALDGVVESGGSSVDQSSITGESMPMEKGPGQEVLAGSINQDGELVLRVTKTSNESTIARVITLVEEAQEQQARTERFLERFEQYYAAGVILATILAAVVPPYLFGTEPSLAVYRAITLMVAASPCALIISTPASILSAIGNGARRGILFKGGVHVEQAAGIQAIAFDKTGTLTEGKPRVADIVSLSDATEDELLAVAASLESKSQHVLAAAITAEAHRRELSYSAPQDFRNESGVGIRGTVNGKTFRIGSPAVLRDLPGEDRERHAAEKEIDRLQREGKTVVVLMRESSPDGGGSGVRGLIALEDRLRPGVREIIQDLRDAGIRHVVMLTGDNAAAAEQIAAKAGIDMVFPELLPENKLAAIRRIEEEYGPTAMVGDGINDAPALAGARLGIAMGAAGTDVALETADIVLLSDDLEKLPYLIALSRRTRRTLVVNIAVAMGLIAMMVVGIYTIDLPLPLAVIGHEGGTVLVSLNGVRLLMFRHKRRKHAGETAVRG
jgi:Zn2+/Cd2+-exporting ATPase